MSAMNSADEIRKLRNSGATLASIADKYGVTRQRIYQILGRTGRLSVIAIYQERLQERLKVIDASRDLTTPELCKKLGVQHSSHLRRKYHHPIENCESATFRGNIAEVSAAKLLERNGFHAELMPVHHPFDILVNGKIRIDVKAAYKPKTSPSILARTKSPAWRFKVRQGKRHDADFYFCMITETQDVFIIPSKDVPEHMDLLVFCYPTERPELAKWQNYHDAYDLLEAA